MNQTISWSTENHNIAEPQGLADDPSEHRRDLIPQIKNRAENHPESQAARQAEAPTVVVLLRIVTIALFIFTYPRLLVYFLGPSNPWANYLYMYGFGFMFFYVGIRIIVAQGACKIGRGYDTLWYRILWIGFFFFLILHAAWIWTAQVYPTAR